MPELPDLALYLEHLERRVLGHTLEGVRLASPSLLRSVDPPLSAAAGRRVVGLRRLGKRLVFALDGELFLVLHLMIAGRLHWRKRGAPLPRRRAHAAFDFAHGALVVTEASPKKRASLHVVQGEAALAAHDPGGLEVLEADLAAFRARLAAESHTLKRALTDPRLFSGIGNAYSDEILHAARLSPARLSGQLDPEESERLFGAAREVLRAWIARLRAESGDAFPEKVTAFREGMAVHDRYRKPCPVCATPVRRIAYAENETNYCPSCQTGGRLLADRILSRLLHGSKRLVALALLVACQAEPPPHAREDIAQMLREDRSAVRHASDGGGRAWLEGEARATAGRPGRWTLVYEAGPQGIAAGGALYLMTSPFWGWSTPQTHDRALPGFTEVSTEAEGVALESETVDAQLLAVTVRGRALAPGERVRMVFGAGPEGALADRFAERGERLWLAVDGDGDGVRRVLDDSPALDVAPGPPARLSLALATSARPGQAVELVAALLDAAGNATASAGEVRLELPEGLAGPDRMAPGRASLAVRAAGVWRVRARAGDLEAESNPLVVAEDAERVLWADLHGHSQLSDGTGTPDDWYRYARDVAGLDAAALTDHDHWGVRFLDERPALWEQIRAAVRRFDEPGRFVALLGYEWTSWIHGHRHVLYFGDEGRVWSSLDEAHDDPRELWSALRGSPALTFAHHSAGGPIPTNWGIPPDPELEPVTEVASVHGSSEALDAPTPIYSPVPGNFVRDALGRGYRLGFVGSGDGHDGHPGLAQLASATGGLAAIFAEERTREAVLAALRARRCYATNGPRIGLEARLAGRPMGSAVSREAAEGAELRVRVAAPAAIERIDLVTRDGVARTLRGDGSREVELAEQVHDLRPGDFLYVRVVQADGGAAWSSPFFVE